MFRYENFRFMNYSYKIYSLMVEKNQLQCGRIENDEESNNSETDDTENSFHERNLYIASFPLLASFALLSYFSYLLFLLFHYIWEHLIKLKYFIKPFQRSLVQSKNVNNYNLSININDEEMLKTGSNIDSQLAKQKSHHRRAFEFISMALKIDEENEG